MAVELSDEDFAKLTNAAKFLEEAAGNPTTRREFERMAKKIRPELTTTDDIAEAYAAPVREELTATNKKLDEFLAAQAERDAKQVEAAADRTRDDAFGRLRQEGYTDEGLENIKRLMVDRSIPDPEAAAALFDRMNPKPIEGASSWEPSNWNIREEAVDHDVEGLFRDPEKWGDKAVYDVLKDIRSGNGA